VIRFPLIAALVLTGHFDSAAQTKKNLSPTAIYKETCDASAAIALTEDLFAVASDEDNVIRVYHRDQAGKPVQSIDLSAFLDLDAKKPESDIEGAARVGDRAYWITSHARNKNGRVRLSRERFFATQIIANGPRAELKIVGRPYERLLSDLLRDPRLKRFKLAEASGREPKARGGLNIEGLSATPEGHLLIGFRNPIPDRKALVVPLLNPDDVVHGRAPKLGEPILLDLGALGVRDMAYFDGKYLIAAGSYDGRGQSYLYQWSGSTEPPLLLKDARFKSLNPEAIIFYPDKGWNEIQILSDDGRKLLKGKPCKEAAPDQQHFRSVWVTP
jgi:hypothetical protein